MKEEVVIFCCQRREGMRNVNAGSFIGSILRAPQISCFPSKKEMGAGVCSYRSRESSSRFKMVGVLGTWIC